MMDPEVRDFLADVPRDLRHTVNVLRRLVLAAAPRLSETVLWRSLSYHRPELGGRVKGAVCLITPKADHVELGFIHGVLLPDPRGMLTGHGRSKRVIRIDDAADLEADEPLADLIRAAVVTRPVGDGSDVAPSGGPPRRTTPRRVRRGESAHGGTT